MATASATAEQTDDSGLTVSALFAAVGAVAAGIAVLDATGFIGRIERNNGTPFFVALGLAVAGSFLAAIASSGLLGRDPDAKALRAAAGQAANEASELAVKANQAAKTAQGTAAADAAAAAAAAKDAIDAADRTVDPLLRAAAAADSLASVAKQDSARSAARDAAQDAYVVARRVGATVRDQANHGGRDAAIDAAVSAAGHADTLAHAANAAAVAAANALSNRGLLRSAAMRVRAGIRVLGALLVLAGVILAVLVAVNTASAMQKPVIDVTITPVKLAADEKAATRTYEVDAQTKAEDLDADARITILVDGLHRQAGKDTYTVRNLFHGKYGPDHNGKLDVHARVQVTRGADPDFDIIGVQARIAQTEEEAEPNPCGRYEQQVSTSRLGQPENRAKLQPGCVVVALPGPVSPERATG